MKKRETFSLVAEAKNFLWWSAGVNVSLLTGIKSEWQRFYAIGLTILSSSILGSLSMIIAGNIIFKNIYLSVAFGILWGLMIFFINKSFVSTFRGNSKRNKIGLFLVRTILSITITVTISYPLLLLIFSQAINVKLSSTDNAIADGLLAKIRAFDQLKAESLTVTLFSWELMIFILLMDTLPLVLTWLTSKNSVYETSLKLNDERELAKLSLLAEEEFVMLRNRVTKNMEERKGLDSMPFGGFEIYVDYKSLRLNEINTLFSSLNNIYNSVYKIGNFPDIDPIAPIENIFKSRPEDTLLMHSIETGNSITFKIATCWKPRVEIIKGDFTIYLPKGSVALLITGYLISKLFDYGISKYKEILEIEKTKMEMKVMGNQLLNEEVNKFNSKLESSPGEVKEQFQLDLMKFYKATMDNSNFIKTKITQDEAILEKINRGEVSTVKNIK